MSITRITGDKVQISNGQLSITCDPTFGAAPLSWKLSGNELMSIFPGEGSQTVWDQGSDPTQASPDGLWPNAIATLTGSNLANNYYGREVGPSISTAYKVQMFLNCFWISHEAPDDSIPTESETNWSTLYSNTLSFNPSVYSAPGTPIFFKPVGSKIAGLFFIGNALLPNTWPQNQPKWSSRLAKIQSGNVAGKVRVSLKYASADAYCGLLIRKDIISNSTQDQAYNAPGYHFLVNRSGTWSLSRFPGNSDVAHGKLSTVSIAKLKDAGALLEVRTHTVLPAVLQLYVEGVLIADLTLKAPIYLGSAFGLIGSCNSGYIIFSERQVYDLNFVLTQIATLTTNGIRLSAELNRPPLAPMAPTNVPLYRTNHLSCFWNPADPATYSQYLAPGGNWSPHNPGIVALKQGAVVRMTFPGYNSAIDITFKEITLNTGVASQAHALLSSLNSQTRVTMFNTLPESANQVPVYVGSSKIVYDITPVV